MPQWASWALKSLSGKFYKGPTPAQPGDAAAPAAAAAGGGAAGEGMELIEIVQLADIRILIMGW